MSDRRSFLKASCIACLSVAGAGAAVSFLAGCASGLPVVKGSVEGTAIKVPKKSFGPDNKVIVKLDKLEHNILVVRQGEDQYKALYLQCTHFNNGLTVGTSSLFCSLHGSRFNFNGEVIQEPAPKALRSFPTTFTEKDVFIQLKG